MNICDLFLGSVSRLAIALELRAVVAAFSLEVLPIHEPTGGVRRHFNCIEEVKHVLCRVQIVGVLALTLGVRLADSAWDGPAVAKPGNCAGLRWAAAGATAGLDAERCAGEICPRCIDRRPFAAARSLLVAVLFVRKSAAAC